MAAARDHNAENLEPPRLARVAVGVDFSAPSVAAADWTIRHFAPRAECLLVHAIDVPQPPSFLRDAFPSRSEILKSATEGARARLERIRTAQGWDQVGIRVREGRADTVIAEAAKESGADVVVVGEHARPRGSWSAPGSTAEALVRCSPVPVLLARNVPDGAPRRILVGVDDSAHARHALAWARLLAGETGASVTVVHVFQPVFLNVAMAVSGIDAAAQLGPKQRELAALWLDELVQQAGFASGEVTTIVEQGDPATSIVAVQRGGHDLVIMGSRGAGGAARWLLGSVANAVLRGAGCPVLIVRHSRHDG